MYQAMLSHCWVITWQALYTGGVTDYKVSSVKQIWTEQFSDSSAQCVADKALCELKHVTPPTITQTQIAQSN